MTALPTPEKRRRATPRQIREILERQNGCCAMCGIQLVDLGDEWVRIINAFQIDHIQRLDALGSQTLDNLQALCVPDHKEKTRTDNWEAKKGARIRGERGQRARREKRGGSSIQGRGFSTEKPDDYVSPLSKAARRAAIARREAAHAG